MDELQKLRMNLQQCDNIILDALLMRNQIVEEIMEYKERNGLPIIQPEQEELAGDSYGRKTARKVGYQCV